MSLDHTIARTTIELWQRNCLEVLDAIILESATFHGHT